jgi:ribosomal protein S15P/S13E
VLVGEHFAEEYTLALTASFAAARASAQKVASGHEAVVQCAATARRSAAERELPAEEVAGASEPEVAVVCLVERYEIAEQKASEAEMPLVCLTERCGIAEQTSEPEVAVVRLVEHYGIAEQKASEAEVPLVCLTERCGIAEQTSLLYQFALVTSSFLLYQFALVTASSLLYLVYLAK